MEERFKVKCIVVKGKLLADIGRPTSFPLTVQILDFLGYVTHQICDDGSLEFNHSGTTEYGNDKFIPFFLNGRRIY